MDWFFALEAPTQVAIVGVLAGVVTAAGAVAVAVVNNRRAGGGKTEIAALTIDTLSIKQVAAALEALNVTMTEIKALGPRGLEAAEASTEAGHQLAKATNGVVAAVDKLTDEIRDARRTAEEIAEGYAALAKGIDRIREEMRLDRELRRGG